MLVESEIGLTALLTNATIAIIVIGEGGNIYSINSAAERLIAFSEAELYGQPIEALVQTGANFNPFSAREPINRNGVLNSRNEMSLNMVRKDGSVFPVEIEFSDYKVQGTNFTVLFFRDTTDEQISKDRFATIFYKSPAAKIYSEFDTGIIIDVNDNFCRFSGYAREELLGRTATELAEINQETKDKWVSDVRDHGRISDLEIEFQTKGGSQAFALLSSEQIELSGNKYLLSTCIDITGKKKAMEALKDREVQLREEAKILAELSESGNRLWRAESFQDGLDEMLSYVTGLFGTEMGNVQLFDPERQVLVMGAHKGFRIDFPDHFRQVGVDDGSACARALAGRQMVVIEDVELDKEFAPYVAVARQAGFAAVVSAPLFAHDGSAIGVISVYKKNNGPFDPFHLQVIKLYAMKAESFIESWKINEALRNVNSKLERKVQERTLELTELLKKEKRLNEMKSQFVSIASHEFRTPLTTVLSSIDLIQLYYNRDDHAEKRNEHLAKTRTSIKQLNNILDDFFSLSKLEEGKVMTVPEDFCLSEFAEDTITEVNGILKNGQRIHLRCNNKETVFHDQKVLKNVMLNLLSNAIKYSEEGKEINVIIDIVHGVVSMQVQDQGIGIPDEDQDKLFGKYFRAGNASTIQGTGLGLNIVKRYLELMKGTISFTSKYNEGTTFTVTFPQRLS